MFIMTLMCEGWHSEPIDDIYDIKDNIEDIKYQIEQGFIIALTDDLEYFAENLRIDVKDIILKD